MKTLKSLRKSAALIFSGTLSSAQVGINTDLPVKTPNVNGIFGTYNPDKGASPASGYFAAAFAG